MPEAVSTTRVKGRPSRVIYRVYYSEPVRWRGIANVEEGFIGADRWLSLEVRNEIAILDSDKRVKSVFISNFIKEILKE